MNKVLLFLILITQSLSFASEKDKDTDIVCFAAQSKWICAPKNNQQIAKEKANNLLAESSNTETEKELRSDVVIKPLGLPSFQAIDYSEPKEPAQETINTKLSEKESLDKPRPTQSNSSRSEAPDSDTIKKSWSYQLIGVSTQQAAIQFIQKLNVNKSNIILVESEHNGYDWFVVLYGLYDDKDLGIKDKFNLPPDISKPWLRPLERLIIKSLINDF